MTGNIPTSTSATAQIAILGHRGLRKCADQIVIDVCIVVLLDKCFTFIGRNTFIVLTFSQTNRAAIRTTFRSQTIIPWCLIACRCCHDADSTVLTQIGIFHTTASTSFFSTCAGACRIRSGVGIHRITMKAERLWTLNRFDFIDKT